MRPACYSAVYGNEAYFSANEINMPCPCVFSEVQDILFPAFAGHVYGAGDDFCPLIKNGLTIDTMNTDGGTVCGQIYKDISSCSPNGGYGIYFDDIETVSFEVARGNVSRLLYDILAESLEYYTLFGPTTKKNLERHTALIGRPALPPKWTFGLWLPVSFSFYTIKYYHSVH